MVSTTKLNPKKKRRREDDKKTPKQYQHQTINLKVNSSGNDSTTWKQHQPKQMQLPLSVYDSSLVSPHYGINDRQPTNPFVVDAATDFMTLFFQTLIKNQKQTQQPTQPQPLPTKQPIIITPPINKNQQ